MTPTLHDVARAYTNYRLDKDIQRAKATDVNEAVARFINHDPTLIHENANKDSNVYSTQRDLLAGAVSKAAAFNMLPPAVSNAHMKGDIHFHDADYSPFTAQSNCSLPNFWDMLANGFTLGNAPMASPKSIAIATADYPRSRRTWPPASMVARPPTVPTSILPSMPRRITRSSLRKLVRPSPTACQLPFARRQVERHEEWSPPSCISVPVNRCRWTPRSTPTLTNLSKSVKSSKIRTRKAIYDAMQTMEYQINSNRVSNGQTPFVTVGFGLGTDWFSREVQRAILLNRIRGLGK